MTKTLLLLLSGTLLWAATVSYSYDAAGRLTKIDYGSGGSITYTYDNAGNLTGRTVVSAASATPQDRHPKVTRTASPHDPKKPAQTTPAERPTSAPAS